MTFFVQLLGLIYQEEQFGDSSPVGQYRVSKSETRPASVREEPGRQGFGLSAEERTAVELQAMSCAAAWLIGEGYDIEDVHLTTSCDFIASKEGKEYVVEVKGSTSSGLEAVILTKNEVKLHLETYPNNLLIVVSAIKLSPTSIGASGGDVTVLSPWKIDTDRLLATQFSYRLS